MIRHKFLLGNPCGPCEWHILADIRTYAWFDFIFQMIFVVPVVLQLRINLQLESDIRNGVGISTTTAATLTTSYYSTTTTTTISTNGPTISTNGPTISTNGTTISTSTTAETVEEDECDDSKIHLAVLYSVLDVVNLSMGMVTDMILYAGSKQRNLRVAIATAWIFLICAGVREILHVTGLSLHLLRCSPSTYAYEIVVRCLCQYMIYGIWIAIEYVVWLMRGRLFVPQRGQMEPPPEYMLDEKETGTTLTGNPSDYTEDFTGNPSIEITPPTDSEPFKGPQSSKQELPKSGDKREAELAGSASGEVNEIKPPVKKKKKKLKKKLKIDGDNPPENGDGPGKGSSQQNI